MTEFERAKGAVYAVLDGAHITMADSTVDKIVHVVAAKFGIPIADVEAVPCPPPLLGDRRAIMEAELKYEDERFADRPPPTTMPGPPRPRR